MTEDLAPAPTAHLEELNARLTKLRGELQALGFDFYVGRYQPTLAGDPLDLMVEVDTVIENNAAVIARRARVAAAGE